MQIFNMSAPRTYGLMAHVLLTVSWVILFASLIWIQGTGKTIHPMLVVFAFCCLAFSGIITVAMSQAIPEYWEDLEDLNELKEEARQAIQRYDRAKEELIKSTLKEDYPTGEPVYLADE